MSVVKTFGIGHLGIGSSGKIGRGGGSSGPKWNPSNLIISFISDKEFQLDWIGGVVNADFYSIERSDNGGSFSEIDTTLFGTEEYNDLTVLVDNSYTYRARGIKDGEYSSYSNSVSYNNNESQYRIITGASNDYRKGLRNGYFVIDVTLTELGFEGEENTDWINREQEIIYTDIWWLTHLLPSTISKLLLYGKNSEISSEQMPNDLDGASDYLSVTGTVGSEVYTCPNTQDYIDADTDNIWFDSEGTQRNVLTDELIKFDFSKTFVKYDPNSPFAITEIAILKSGEVLTPDEQNNIIAYFELSIFWSGLLSAFGFPKDNRDFARSLWNSQVILPSNIDDGKVLSWYSPLEIDGAVRDGEGIETIYWDLMKFDLYRSPEINSGSLIKYGVYEITSCAENYFYTGCQIGDVFACLTVKTCDITNKVKFVLGNHLSQGNPTYKPVNGVFSTSYLQTMPNAELIQPISIYMVVKQKAWGSLNTLLSASNIYSGGLVKQSGTTPNLSVSAGIESSLNANLALNTFGILRIILNGANSLFQIDDTEAIEGNFGLGKYISFTLGGRVTPSNFANIEFKEMIVRLNADDITTHAAIYNYLKTKHGL